MPYSSPALNQRGEANPPPSPALATRRSRLGTVGFVRRAAGTRGSLDLLEAMAAGRQATAATLKEDTFIKGQGAGPAIPQLLPAHPALHPALLLAVLPLLLLLNRRNRATLREGWSWMLFTIGALVEPLRPRRHLIHDRNYHDKMLEAEFAADSDAGPKGSRRPSQASSGSAREATSSGQADSSDAERPSHRPSDSDSGPDSARSRQP